MSKCEHCGQELPVSKAEAAVGDIWASSETTQCVLWVLSIDDDGVVYCLDELLDVIVIEDFDEFVNADDDDLMTLVARVDSLQAAKRYLQGDL